MRSPRVQSIDLLRGAVMMIMALDHIREFTHADSQIFQPDDLRRASALLFFTRWITHFCAPVFMLTAGIGAFLWARGKTRRQLSRFLLTRGLWLIALELLVVHLAFNFNFDYGFIILNIFWALGWSMICLAGLCRVPMPLLTGFCITIIAVHNLMDKLPFKSWIWNFLHQIGVVQFHGTTIVFAYSLIPWFAVMALGYCVGPVFTWEPERRRRFLIGWGIGLAIAFIVIRALNIYGDPVPWQHQFRPVLSFLRVNKYPPSLDFLLMTLGPALIVMGLLEKVRASAKNPFLIFGRVPLFYFVVHIFLIHAGAILLSYFKYGDGSFFFNPLPSMGGPAKLFPPNYGFSLGVVYAFWVTLIVVLYPLCRWFAGVKQRRTDWWLGYL
jgi:uncharacterized membrane protein